MSLYLENYTALVNLIKSEFPDTYNKALSNLNEKEHSVTSLVFGIEIVSIIMSVAPRFRLLVDLGYWLEENKHMEGLWLL